VHAENHRAEDEGYGEHEGEVQHEVAEGDLEGVVRFVLVAHVHLATKALPRFGVHVEGVVSALVVGVASAELLIVEFLVLLILASGVGIILSVISVRILLLVASIGIVLVVLTVLAVLLWVWR
jgi:hypothetical protein